MIPKATRQRRKIADGNDNATITLSTSSTYYLEMDLVDTIKRKSNNRTISFYDEYKYLLLKLFLEICSFELVSRISQTANLNLDSFLHEFSSRNRLLFFEYILLKMFISDT